MHRYPLPSVVCTQRSIDEFGILTVASDLLSDQDTRISESNRSVLIGPASLGFTWVRGDTVATVFSPKQ